MVEPKELDVDERAIAAGPTTESQRRELRRRLAEYRANADDPVVTLADIRRELRQP